MLHNFCARMFSGCGLVFSHKGKFKMFSDSFYFCWHSNDSQTLSLELNPSSFWNYMTHCCTIFTGLGYDSLNNSHCTKPYFLLHWAHVQQVAVWVCRPGKVIESALALTDGSVRALSNLPAALFHELTSSLKKYATGLEYGVVKCCSFDSLLQTSSAIWCTPHKKGSLSVYIPDEWRLKDCW